MTNNKTIMVLVIAAAFVTGTLTTGTIEFAENLFNDKCTKQLNKNNLQGYVCRS